MPKPMTEVIVVVRHPKSKAIEYSLSFALPELPRVGDHLSIQRPDVRKPLGEDLIVRQVWWRLHHNCTGEAEGAAGGLTEIFVECDPVITAYSSAAWRYRWEGAGGVEVRAVGRMA